MSDRTENRNIEPISKYEKITFLGLFTAIMVATVADGLQAGQQVTAARDSDSSKTNGFSFDGGTLFMFMNAVKQKCGLDLQKYAEIASLE